MKIGRNQPCYCGSGKKYKKCCMGKENKRRFPWPTYPEDYVLRDLLKDSALFRKFYGLERRKITRPVFWAKDVTLPDGIDYRSTRLDTGEQIIRLRRIPASVQDAQNMAHELEHFVMDFEGYPCMGSTDPHENLASSLNSMLHDPLVNQRLKAHGFSLTSEYEQELRDTIRQLDSEATVPTGRYVRIRWIFNYVSKLIDYEVAYGVRPDDKEEFRSYFDKKYPDVVRDSQQLLGNIRQIGYDTPEKLRKLLLEIRHQFSLENMLTMRDFTS